MLVGIKDGIEIVVEEPVAPISILQYKLRNDDVQITVSQWSVPGSHVIGS